MDYRALTDTELAIHLRNGDAEAFQEIYYRHWKKLLVIARHKLPLTDNPEDLILDERRLELAFEYKRWYDIKRRDLGDRVFKGANSLEPHANFDKNRDYLMPLPRLELQINPNLAPQNPGY